MRTTRGYGDGSMMSDDHDISAMWADGWWPVGRDAVLFVWVFEMIASEVIQHQKCIACELPKPYVFLPWAPNA